MNQKEYLNKANDIYDLIEKAHDKKLTFWFENVTFTWQWWLGVFLTIIPWIIIDASILLSEDYIP